MIPQDFSYHRAEMPYLYALLALSAVELVVVHLVLASLSAAAAWVASAMTLALFVLFVRLIHTMRTRPITVGASGVRLRSGFKLDTTLPPGAVTAVSALGPSPPARTADTRSLSLLAGDNVEIMLAGPQSALGLRYSRIRLRLDDPAGFVAAVRASILPSGRALLP